MLHLQVRNDGSDTIDLVRTCDAHFKEVHDQVTLTTNDRHFCQQEHSKQYIHTWTGTRYSRTDTVHNYAKLVISGAYEPPKAARNVRLHIIAQNSICIYSSK